jgi:hypothetical protein
MKKRGILYLSLVALVLLLTFAQTVTFHSDSMLGADVRVGIHSLYPTSMCKGITLPLGKYGSCIGLTGHYWE